MSLLLTPLSADDPLFEKIDDGASSAVIKCELDDLRAAIEKLTFMDHYLEKSMKDVADRRHVLLEKQARLELVLINVRKKEAAEQLVMDTIGGTRNEVNDKITDMLGAFASFKNHRDDKAFASQAKGIRT